MDKYYLAVDIGASSGRHILGHLENGKVILEEIYRFSNGMIEKDNEKCWNVDKLFYEIKEGMKKCKELDKIPISMGIDTWAVDFVLLDKENNRIGNAVGYRDKRTIGMDTEVNQFIENKDLYFRTGIQKQIFNTIYQIMAIKKRQPQYLKNAETLLMIPDYFNFLLTGKKATEYTNATTTQLVCAKTKIWDADLIRRLGFPEKIFQRIGEPGTLLGNLTEDIQLEVGYNCDVVLVATHDTGSAVMAVPSKYDNSVYISSGTWSLMGTELKEANCTEKSRAYNFTNEGGYDYRFRYLKNIMGLWMIQSAKQEIAPEMEFSKICEMASLERITSIIDCNEERFLAPNSMTAEIQAFCRETKQQIPEEIAEVAAVIYNSLAKSYKKTLEEIEDITNITYDTIHVVGGGANATYLNELIAKETGRRVLSGPTEATAIGNLIAQMLWKKEFPSLKEARRCISKSFLLTEYGQL